MKNLNVSAISIANVIRTGIFMWPNKIVFFGPIEQLDAHKYGAVALQIGLYSHFYIRFNNTHWLPTRCAIVPAGIKHEIRFPNGIFGKLFIEQGCSEYLCFKERFPHRNNIPTLFFDQQVIQSFQTMDESGFNKNSIHQHVNSLIEYQDRDNAGFDFRVQKAIEIFNSDICRNYSIDRLAKEVDLSPSRFRHLFVEQTGIAYSQFRIWQRLRIAEMSLNKIDSLTWAAIDAGFSDLSHFSRHYKNAFGIKPSSVFKTLNDFEI